MSCNCPFVPRRPLPADSSLLPHSSSFSPFARLFCSPASRTDPGVFTGLLHELGVRGLEVEELWGLDQALLQEL